MWQETPVWSSSQKTLFPGEEVMATSSIEVTPGPKSLSPEGRTPQKSKIVYQEPAGLSTHRQQKFN